MAAGSVTTKDYRENLKKLQGDVEKKYGKPIPELFKERQQRLWDVIAVKEPDRVPVILGGSYFAAKHGGIPYSSVYYDFHAWKKAATNMLADYGPDTYGELLTTCGPAMDILGAKNTLWPGGTLPEDAAHMYVDDEYMKEDEYDHFLADSTDFITRRYMPRIYSALEPMLKFPTVNVGRRALGNIAQTLATEEYRQVGQAMVRAGEEEAKWTEAMAGFNDDLASLGFPSFNGGVRGFVTGSPAFDVMGNAYRGWKGLVRDMYRRPEKLIAAIEKINEIQMSRAVPADTSTPGPKIGGGGAIHRGSDRFLSREQWEKFYWPTWKKSMERAIELGYIPFIFAEGFCEERFEYFLEMPKGKIVIRFTDTDMFKAKAALKDHCCIMGNVPLTLMQIASPSEIEEYCRKLIDVCGKGGGYIMRTDTDYIQDAKPENVRAMMDTVMKYGKY